MSMIRFTFKLVTGITFQTRDGSHVSTHIVDGLQLMKLVTDSVFLEFICFFQLSVATTSNVSHVEVHAPLTTIRISFGWGLRECGRDTEHFQTSFLSRLLQSQEPRVHMSGCSPIVAKQTCLLPRCLRNACASRISLCTANHSALLLIPSTWDEEI